MAVLKVREATLPPDHPDTLESRNDLAIAYRAAGRTDEAIAMLEAIAESATRRRCGPDHPDTLTCRSNLAVAYRAAGRIDEAIATHEAVLKIREEKLGPDHPDTVSSRSSLAVAYRAAGASTRRSPCSRRS